jgi:hypothetical protein
MLLNTLPQVLPLALWNSLTEEVRKAVMKVSRVYRRLCAREIVLAERDSDMADAAEALCLLEKVFPPTFMDIMSHLMIHLVEELYVVDQFIVDGCIQLNSTGRS